MGDIISGIGGYLGSQKTAAAAEDAARTQQIMYLQTRADLNPYNVLGQTAAGNALSLAQGGTPDGQPNYLNMAGTMFPGGLPGGGGAGMTQAQLEQTPGYQFTLSQGLKATQSAAAARGLGMSGASMKGAAQYATGLADNTYANRFNEAQQQFTDAMNLGTQQFNRYNTLATLGENAAAHTGIIGQALAQNYGDAQLAQGAAQAQGIQGLAKGIGSTVNFLSGQAALPTQGGGSSGYGTA